MTSYTPTANDIAWTKRLWAHLNVGGLWSYKNKPIVVRKDSEDRATLFSFKNDHDEIVRLEAVMKACHISTSNADEGEGYATWC
jgi:hypothetical protein